MKKQLLFAGLFLGALLSTNAQTTVWSDNFDDLDITDWTLVDDDGDTFNWSAVQIQDNGGNPVGTPVMRSQSWVNGTPLTPDNWAISPAVDLTSYTSSDQITLSWKAMAIDADFDAENYAVYVGTSTDIAVLVNSTTTFTEVLTGINTLTERTLDISDFVGETVYVAFRHFDVTDEFTMEIDDVAVTAGVLNTEEFLNSSISVYPNPATNLINVSAGNNISVDSVSIVDLNGRVVKNVNYDNISQLQLNISDLSSGMYLMNINSQEGVLTKKIVKN